MNLTLSVSITVQRMSPIRSPRVSVVAFAVVVTSKLIIEREAIRITSVPERATTIPADNNTRINRRINGTVPSTDANIPGALIQKTLVK